MKKKKIALNILSIVIISALLNCLFIVQSTYAMIPSGYRTNLLNSGDGQMNGVETIYGAYPLADGRIAVGGWFGTQGPNSPVKIAMLKPDLTMDTSFNTGTGVNNYIRTVAQQSDGKLLFGGAFTDFNGIGSNRIARVNLDGSIDTTFNIGTGANNNVEEIVVLSDGRILISGSFTTFNNYSRNRIAVINSDGSLDQSFDPGVGANNTVNRVLVGVDGKYLLNGSFTSFNGTTANRIVKINTDGSIDSSFNTSLGGANGVVSSIAMQSDGKIVAVGAFTTYNEISKNRIVRINTDGTVDTSFNIGTGVDATINGVCIENDGSILIAGSSMTTYDSNSISIAARISSSGNFIKSLNLPNATQITTGVSRIIKTTVGETIIVGSFKSFSHHPRNSIVVLNSDDTLKDAFEPNVGASANIFSFREQADGKIIIVGYFSHYNGEEKNGIVRVNRDGSNDVTFNTGTGFTGGSPYSIAIQDDGKIIIGGAFINFNNSGKKYLVRLNVDGSIDSSFNIVTGPNSYIFDTKVLSDRKILISGNLTLFDGVPFNRIGMLNEDGSINTSFNIGTGPNNSVNEAIPDNSGKYMLRGIFTSFAGFSRKYIVRLNSDGSVDTSFDTASGFNNSVSAIKPTSDGKYFIGGWFTSINGQTANYIAKLNNDGTIDTSFNTGNGVFSAPNGISAQIADLLLKKDGKILAIGYFSQFNSINRNSIIQLNTDGSYDSTFDGDINYGPQRINYLSDGSILVAGWFTSFRNVGTNSIVNITDNNLYQIDNSIGRMDFIGPESGSYKIGSLFGSSANSVPIQVQSNGYPAADVIVDFSTGGADKDWNTVTADVDVNSKKSVVFGLSTANGVVGGTHSLYIPRELTDTYLIICPLAESLTDISGICSTDIRDVNDPSVSILEVDGQSYWVVTGLSGTGGESNPILPTATPTITNTPTETSTPSPTETRRSGGGGGHHSGGGGGGSRSTSTPVKTSTPNYRTATVEARETATAVCTEVPRPVRKNNIDFANYENGYQAEWISQEQAHGCFEVKAGDSIPFWVEIKNTGEKGWVSSKNQCSSDNNEVTFAIRKDISKAKLDFAPSAPQVKKYDILGDLEFGKSYFKHSSWVSEYRIGTMEDEIVLPGETTRIPVTFQIPTDAEKGKYREDFGMAIGPYWVYNPTNGDPGQALNVWVCLEIN